MIFCEHHQQQRHSGGESENLQSVGNDISSCDRVRGPYGNDDSFRHDPGMGDVTYGSVSISAAQLAYMLDGIDWRNPVHTFRPERAG